MMLARVADSLYWIGRYVERAEHVSRLSDIMLTATLDQNEAAIDVAHVALAAVGEPDERGDGRTALDAVADWRFVPAKVGDRAVVGSVLVPIHFSLRETP